jgi:hypothetical protein
MSNAKRLRENAENCAELAEDAADDANRRRYLLMEQTYLRLAETEEWLDGRVSPFAQHAATRSEG